MQHPAAAGGIKSCEEINALQKMRMDAALGLGLYKKHPDHRCRQRLQCVVKLNRPRECIRDAQLKLSRDLAAVACKVKDINRLLTLCVD